MSATDIHFPVFLFIQVNTSTLDRAGLSDIAYTGGCLA
jgi:hypothetical protein